MPAWAAPEMGHFMQRYFFTLRGRDPIGYDREGRYLPDVAAALSYAEHLRAAKKERPCRSGSGYARTGSRSADGFVLAVFPRLLKVCHGTYVAEMSADSVQKPLHRSLVWSRGTVDG
jgi:hypothetical protein